jgi:septal ring factor EnvC (AmiA/AmiB activator)
VLIASALPLCLPLCFVSFVPFVSFVRASAQAPARARAEALATRAGERLQALRREADALAQQERTLLGDLRQLEIDRQIKAEAVKDADAKVAAVTTEVAQTRARMEALQRQDEGERPGLRARLVEIYKLGQGRYLKLLLSTSNLRRIGQSTRVVAELAEQDRRRIAERQKTLSDLQAAQTRLLAQQHEAQQLGEEARRAATAAASTAAAKSALIRDIDQRRDLNAQLTAELQSAQQKLQLALRDLSAGDVPALPLRPFRGALPWPVAGTVRYRVGGTAARGAASSNGIEIAATEGTAVHAVHDGLVAFAGPFAGFGNLVIVDHGGRAFSLYGHLLDVAVTKGARVGAGEEVGTVGPAPAGPPGLYFELRVDGRPVDPLQWLGKR